MSIIFTKAVGSFITIIILLTVKHYLVYCQYNFYLYFYGILLQCFFKGVFQSLGENNNFIRLSALLSDKYIVYSVLGRYIRCVLTHFKHVLFVCIKSKYISSTSELRHVQNTSLSFNY